MSEAKILIFGGTTEGRQLAAFCAAREIPVYVSVATDYGGELLEDLARSGTVQVLTGRKEENAIAAFIRQHQIACVIDATHPYAVEVGRNIAAACETCNVKNIRVLRESSDSDGDGTYFDDIDAVIDFLNISPEGNILITTGSKDLARFCRLRRFSERCAVRVLPAEGIVEKCTALGFAPANIIPEKGPFSEAQNIAHLRQYGVKYLVTKESGRAGGFAEKACAAKACGASLLVIRRPRDSGISLEETEHMLIEEYGGKSHGT